MFDKAGDVVLQLLVFLSGAILMSLEILGSRVLAPTYGNSIFVWGSLIGVFLGALSAGYWLGGLLADARPRWGALAAVLVGAGVLVWAVPALIVPVVALAGTGPRSGPLLAATGLFFLPSVLMGMVSPYAIRLHGAAEGHLGRTAGRLYALSTFGSIFGTLGTAFYLVPLTGVADLVRWLGVGLVLLAGLALVAGRQWRRAGAALLVGALALAAAPGGPAALVAPGLPAGDLGTETGYSGERLQVVYRVDSLYHHIRVSEGAGARFLRFDNSWQSGMALDDPFRSVFDYTDYFHLGFALRPQARDVLVVGLGGGLIPKQIWKDYPDARVDAVEIDPAVVAVARRYFGLPDDPRLQVHVQDGRRFLAATDRRYDLIVLDAYYADAIPFHLTTREFLELTQSRLKDGGMVAANVIGALSGPKSALFASFYHTLAQGFPERYVFAHGWARDPRSEVLRNLIVFAGDRRTLTTAEVGEAVAAAGRRGMPAAYTSRGADLLNGSPDLRLARLLTDDHAPVENLLKIGD